jgi:phosphate transport system substrate-binding protein
MKRRFAVVFLVLMLFVTACASIGLKAGDESSASSQPTQSPVTGRITFAGSTTLQPLAHELGQVFKEQYPEVELDIAAGGSVVGIEAIHGGTVDIGMASRALKSEEAQGITAHRVAVDVIAVIVNEENPVRSLSWEQLGDVYLGKITHWSQVGGPERPIVVVVRGKNSGTRGAFDKLVLNKQEPAAPDVRTAATAGDVAAIVASHSDAVGYVGFGNLDPGLKLLAINDVLPSEETARDGSYQLVRPLLFLTGPLTQPLALTFVDFALSAEGQEIVVASGWVPAE